LNVASEVKHLVVAGECLSTHGPFYRWEA